MKDTIWTHGDRMVVVTEKLKNDLWKVQDDQDREFLISGADLREFWTQEERDAQPESASTETEEPVENVTDDISEDSISEHRLDEGEPSGL